MSAWGGLSSSCRRPEGRADPGSGWCSAAEGRRDRRQEAAGADEPDQLPRREGVAPGARWPRRRVRARPAHPRAGYRWAASAGGWGPSGTPTGSPAPAATARARTPSAPTTGPCRPARPGPRRWCGPRRRPDGPAAPSSRPAGCRPAVVGRGRAAAHGWRHSPGTGPAAAAACDGPRAGRAAPGCGRDPRAAATHPNRTDSASTRRPAPARPRPGPPRSPLLVAPCTRSWSPPRSVTGRGQVVLHPARAQTASQALARRRGHECRRG